MQRIYKILGEFQPCNGIFDRIDTQTILANIFNPPLYIIEIIFFGLLKFKNFGSMDKVWWHTYFRYKDFLFMIRDYKFNSWSIECEVVNDKTKKLSIEILTKIKKASKIVDRVLSNELRREIDKDNFFLPNQYYKLLSIYKFYERKITNKIRYYKKSLKKEKTLSKISEIMNAYLKYEKELSFYTFALVVSFFSLLDFLINTIFIFEHYNSVKEFWEFLEKDWRNRFKTVFPINKNKELKYIYEEILTIRKEYRNLFAHGFMDKTKEIQILISLPKFGLVPISYEYLNKKLIYLPVLLINQSEAFRIVQIFRKFLKFISTQNPYKFYTLYLKFQFPIPVAQKEIYEIKSKMVSYKKFEQYLQEQSELETMILNRDI